ncbi:hypothetical protein DYB32_006873 [Aphanomyces invadans]|uniref:Uncharacterized protein n=1 Tax=Aphanomyces invadans TaxID=157072 RepID=A0A3R6WIT1_9STRA|nr:hypothetical protein DYB32_006873 [Aphanomyces invadans]
MAATAASKRHITQETFNECVRENMEEFDMSEEDAIADAVTQFESQGVDLSTVVKGLDVVHPVLTALHAIEADESDDEISLQGHLKTLQEQFNDALVSDGAKELAGRSNGPVILVQRLPAVLEVDTRIMLLEIESINLLSGTPELLPPSISGCSSLAIRNMVVRNEALRPIILEDPHVESQLRLAMPIRGCGDEAYAALRDLGADVPLASIGQAQSANFNPVMESSNQLVGRIQENATAPFGEFD